MRYSRLLLWILFVVVFLVYLTAIKLVRGDRQQQQQQRYLQPYFGHTYASRESDLFRQAREFPADYITFEQQGSSQLLPLLSPTGYQQQAHQSQISRRQHLPPQTSALHSLHPFVALQNPSSVAQSKKVPRRLV